MQVMTPLDSAAAMAGYRSLAPFYDAYTEHPAYAEWIRGLDDLARSHTPARDYVLDVACGTGKSLEPIVARGARGVGVDVVPEMLSIAGRRLAGRPVRLVEGEMTALPQLGAFDVVFCVNDALNCLPTSEAVERALRAMARNLRPGGVLVFDTSTTAAYRTVFAEEHARGAGDLTFRWRGTASQSFAPGDRAVAYLDVLRDGDEEPVARSVHVQRHHPREVVEAALRAAGLEVLGRYGQHNDGRRDDEATEDDHFKAVWVAARSRSPMKRGGVQRAQGEEAPAASDADAVAHEDRVSRPLSRGRRLPRRPRLKRTLDVRRLASGRWVILRGDVGEPDLELEGAAVAALLELLDGTRSVGAVAAELARPEGEVREAVRELVDARLLEDADADRALWPERRERFDRQLGFFGDLVAWPRSGPGVQARLAERTVVLLGLGGLGSWAAWGLACAGVGRIVGVDGDRVELGNLNRQILYAERDVGAAKAEVAERTLRAFDGRLRFEPVHRMIESADDVVEVVAGADLVLSGADSPPHLIDRWVDEGCRRAGVPWLGMSQQPPRIRIGPLSVPGQTGCRACEEAAWRERYPLYDELVDAGSTLGSAGAFGPACGVVGALAANEAVAFLADLWEPATLGASLLVDLRTFAVTREEVPQRPDCACALPAAAPGRAAA